MKIIASFLSKWWKSSLVAALAVILCLSSLLTEYYLIQDLALSFYLLAILLVIVSFLYQLFSKRWKQMAFTSISLLFLIAFFLFYYFCCFWISQTRPDNFANNVVIPQNIGLNLPISYELQRTEIRKAQPDFEIYNSFQPGLYKYNFWIDKTEKGIIYLKAYEITNEYRPSEDNLMEQSSMEVYNSTNTIIRFETKNNFTIYEGNWGKPYAARFEIWFRPNGRKEEYKLMEKIYKIEGWQR